MDDKCSKYEGLFVFSDKETLERHLESCAECQEEHKKMQQVSGLIDEVKFYYKAKKSRMRKLKAICAAFFLVIVSATSGMIAVDSDFADTLMYGEELSAEDMGFPVDSYGILMVDE